jgi:hypothetical protein
MLICRRVRQGFGLSGLFVSAPGGGCSTDEGQKALEPLVLPRIPAATWHWIPAHQQNHMVSFLFRDKLVINK